MKDQEKINMEINIGTEPIRVSVPFQQQEQTRRVEDEINSLLETWKRTFPKRTEKGLMAMLLYQYASYYQQLTDKYREATAKAEDCLKQVEDAIKNQKDGSQ